MDYFSIVIFKNKIKKKIIKNFKTLNKSIDKFDKIISENQSIVFEKEIENGVKCDYELLILGPYDPSIFFYIKDDFGKNIKIQSDSKDFSIYKISKYKKEEKIFDFDKNSKINFETFCSDNLKDRNIITLTKFNNKIIKQFDEKIKVFSLKSESDCERFFYLIENFVMSEKLSNILLLRDFDNSHKKYLYDHFNKLGLSKDFLYRRSTTHLK